MPGSWPANELPNLVEDNCQITSRPTRRYNCLAWAAQEDHRWWWPDPMGVGYWPPAPVPREVTMQAFMEAYETLGYKLCLTAALESGLEKIAIFGKKDISGTAVPTHAALQLPSGFWTSKLGIFEDIMHKTVEAVSGPVYGAVVLYMQRPRRSVAAV